MRRPLILLTNDDGLHSPGLTAAAAAIHDLGSLVIAAPREQQSSMSRSLPAGPAGAILSKALEVAGKQLQAYGILGSPAQAVLYAVIDLLDQLPDLVIAGINHGENLGTSTTISGTVGAALQAADMGVPALAVSLETSKESHNASHYRTTVDWTAAAHFTRCFAAALLNGDLPADVDILKVDVPATATPDTPWRLTRQSRQSYYRPLPTNRADLSHPEPMDYEVYIDYDRLEPDSDIYAFAVDRVVAVTPLSLDLTSRADRQVLQACLARGGMK